MHTIRCCLVMYADYTVSVESCVHCDNITLTQIVNSINVCKTFLMYMYTHKCDNPTICHCLLVTLWTLHPPNSSAKPLPYPFFLDFISSCIFCKAALSYNYYFSFLSSTSCDQSIIVFRVPIFPYWPQPHFLCFIGPVKCSIWKFYFNKGFPP